MKRVLILCTGNSCRSQMAEALWAHLGAGEWESHSAGSRPSGYVHPLAVRAIGEIGLDITKNRSKSVDEFEGQPFDLVVTVCGNAKDSCPVFPSAHDTRHWPFDDPADAEGTDDEKMAMFRRVRDEIREKIGAYVRGEAPTSLNMSKPIVLFLCTGNSARSQMAEAILRHLAGDRFDVRSAGLDPRPIHPLTIEVMREAGIDLTGQHPKSVGEFLGKVAVRYPIAVCAAAEQQCPRIWPFGGSMAGWAIDDPAAVEGSERERLEAFRTARDTIRGRIEDWLSQQPDGAMS